MSDNSKFERLTGWRAENQVAEGCATCTVGSHEWQCIERRAHGVGYPARDREGAGMRVALINPHWTFEGSIYFGCRILALPLGTGT